MFNIAAKFVRPRILVSCYAVAFLGAATTGPITIKTVLTILVLIFWYIHAASANDYSDHSIDSINFKNPTDRPLLTQNASFKKLWQIHILAGILAVMFSTIYGLGAVGFTIVMLLLNYAYSFKPIRITDRGIISQYFLAFAYVYYPFTLGYSSNGTNKAFPWLLSFGIYLAFVARLLLKDFRDVKGDKKHGKMTFVLRHGVEYTCKVSALFLILAISLICYEVSFSFGLTCVLIASLTQAIYFLILLSKTRSIKGHESMVALIAKSANISLVAILTYYLTLSQKNISNTEMNLIIVLPYLSFLSLNLLRGFAWKRIYFVH